MLNRIRNAAADALMLFVLPCAVALLPWKLGFAVLKHLARCESLYRLTLDPAWTSARIIFPNCDEHEWKRHFRLVRLVDHVDVYLTRLRGRRWRRRHVVQTGELPAPGPCVFLTYHWGAGGWVWPGLREGGFRARFIARRASGQALGMTRLSHWFGKLRACLLRRSAGAEPIFTGTSTNEIQRTLDAGHSVVGMLDLPARAEQYALIMPLLGRSVRFPAGLVRIATKRMIPLVLFSCGLDFESGQRDIRIETLPPGLAPAQIMQRYVAHLDARLRQSPAAWQIWREAPGFFVDAANDQAL